jgi:hypothetical protein
MAEQVARQLHGQMLMLSSQSSANYPDIAWDEAAADLKRLRVDAIERLIASRYIAYGDKVAPATRTGPSAPGGLEVGA